MASSTIEILINIKNAGLKAFENIRKNMEEIKSPDMNLQTEKIIDAITVVGESVQKVLQEANENISATVDNAVILVQGGGQKLTRTAEGMSETFNARVIASVGASVGILFEMVNYQVFSLQNSVIRSGKKWIENSNLLGSFLRSKIKEISGILDGVFGRTILNTKVVGLYLSDVFTTSFRYLMNSSIGISGILTNVYKIMSALTFSMVYFSLSRMFLGQALGLIKRIFGYGEMSISPLQRASRLITTIDSGLTGIRATAGSLLTTVGATFLALSPVILGFINPLAGIIPILGAVNMWVSTFIAWTQRGRLKFHAFFGSSRAQLQLVLMDARELMYKIVPKLFEMGVDKLILSMVSGAQLVANNAEKAKQTIKEAKGVVDTTLQGVARSAAPIGQQFQAFVAEFRPLITEIATSLRKIIGVAAEGFGSSDEKVQEIGNKARSGIAIVTEEGKSASDTIFGDVEKKSTGIFGKIKGVASSFWNWITGRSKEQTQEVINAATTVQKKKESQTREIVPLDLPKFELGKKVQPQVQPQVKIAPPEQKKDLSETINLLMSYETILARVKEGRGIFADLSNSNKQMHGQFRQFITAIQNFLVSGSTVTKTKMQGVFTTILTDIVGRVEEIPFAFLRLHSSTGIIKQAFDTFSADVANAAKTTGIEKEGDTLGQKFTKSITAGVKETSSPEAKEATKKMLDSFQVLLTSGLSNFKLSGTKIPEQIAQGMKSNEKQLKKAAGDGAEVVADYFPQSPAEAGPLRTLVQSGYKIPMQLAQGMESGMDNLAQVVDKIAENITKHLKPAIEIGNTAIRIGIDTKDLSLIEYSMAGLGVTSNDLQMVFSNFNKVLNETVSPEQLASIKMLGVDLDKVRQSSSPMVTMYAEVSDALSKLPPQSELARKGMEAFGITAGSNVALAFRKTKNEIKDTMLEGAKLGAFWTNEFAAQSSVINTIWEKIKKVKDFIFRDFFTAILPVLEEISTGVFKFVQENSERIRIVTYQIGLAIRTIWNIVYKTFLLFTKDAEKGTIVIIDMLLSIIQTAIVIASDAVSLFGEEIIQSIWLILTTISDIVFAWVTYLFKRIGPQASKLLLDYIFVPLTKKIDDLIDIIIDKLGRFAPEWLKNMKGISQSFKIFSAGATWIDEDFRKTFVKEAQKIEGDAKESLKKIMGHAKESFSSEKIKKFMESTKANGKQMFDDLKRAAKGTDLEEEIKNLENVFSTGSTENVRKQINSMSEEAKKGIQNVIDGVKEVPKAVEGSAKEAGNYLERMKKKFGYLFSSEEMLRLGQQEALLEINDRVAQSFESKHAKEMTALDKRHSDEMKKLIYLRIKEEELDKARELQRKERSKAEENYTYNVIEQTSGFLAQNAQTLASSLDTLYELSGKSVKEFFFLAKGAAIAEATMNVAQGISKALAQGGTWGIAQGAIVAAAGAIQIAKIVAQTISGEGMVEGGQVEGPGGIDNVPARLTAGEFVQPKPSVNYYGSQIMEAIRQRAIPKDMLANLVNNLPNPMQTPKLAFAMGGMVMPTQQVAQTKEQQRPIQLTQINVPDPNMLENSLQSTRGKNTFVNFLTNNKIEVKRAIFGE